MVIFQKKSHRNSLNNFTVRKEYKMAKKLYVGNINFKTTSDELRELFGQFGDVLSVKIITDFYTGQSKGFGFIEMDSIDEATNAISSLNGHEHAGRKLKVNEAFEKGRSNFPS